MTVTAPTARPTSGWGVLRRALRRRRRHLAPYVLLLCSWQLCEALVPVLIGVTIDRGVATGEAGTFGLWAGAVALLFVVLSYSWRFGARVGLRAIETETHELRMEVAEHALDPRGARADRLAGETLSLDTSDAEEVGQALRMVGYGVAAAVALVVTAVVLLRIDVLLGVVVLVGVPLTLGLTQLATPMVSRRSREQQERAAASAGVAVDLVRGLRVLHGVGGEAAASRRYRTTSAAARDAGIGLARARSGLFGLASGLSGLFLAVVTLLAGRLALEGQISVGELIAIVGLTQFLAEPITILADLSAQVASAVASGQRVVEFLATPLVGTDGGIEPASASGVGVGAGAAALAVPERGLASPPGELLGLVVPDPTEAGALLALLAGDVSPEEAGATVHLEGRAVHAMRAEERRARLVVVPHRADLLEGTLRSNVDPWGRHGEEGVRRVLRASAADDVAALRAGGLEQQVAADGGTYSGGQRQRVAVARALASDAPVLVLHEPTSAVDSVTEQRIARGLRSLRTGGGEPGAVRTTWLVTSSPVLLEHADRVVLVEDGQVRCEGTHHDLLAQPGYRAAVLR
ncbi:ABC transporter ATP-binding protein [Nocardioides nanhaiensis]|uniref:ABC transporter ATP-binding protein n=1 Tax=Nocardioides nanhaiensis TaxID=1476871 RepID=A0ABP8X100_9ACTN